MPVAVLSGGPIQGAVSQEGRARGEGEALNNETEQSIRQDGEGEGGNSASQSASNSQILPIALGASLAIPVNLNVPVSVLSLGPAQGDVSQRGDAGARSRGVNLEHEQNIRQTGGEGGNSASQSASNSQILPIALGAALAIPINANIPVSILSSGPSQGNLTQKGKANACVRGPGQRDRAVDPSGRQGRQRDQPVGRQLADPPDRARRGARHPGQPERADLDPVERPVAGATSARRPTPTRRARAWRTS